MKNNVVLPSSLRVDHDIAGPTTIRSNNSTNHMWNRADKVNASSSLSSSHQRAVATVPVHDQQPSPHMANDHNATITEPTVIKKFRKAIPLGRQVRLPSDTTPLQYPPNYRLGSTAVTTATNQHINQHINQSNVGPNNHNITNQKTNGVMNFGYSSNGIGVNSPAIHNQHQQLNLDSGKSVGPTLQPGLPSNYNNSSSYISTPIQSYRNGQLPLNTDHAISQPPLTAMSSMTSAPHMSYNGFTSHHVDTGMSKQYSGINRSQSSTFNSSINQPSTIQSANQPANQSSYIQNPDMSNMGQQQYNQQQQQQQQYVPQGNYQQNNYQQQQQQQQYTPQNNYQQQQQYVPQNNYQQQYNQQHEQGYGQQYNQQQQQYGYNQGSNYEQGYGYDQGVNQGLNQGVNQGLNQGWGLGSGGEGGGGGRFNTTRMEIRREAGEAERKILVKKLDRMEKMFEWAKVPKLDEEISVDDLRACYNRYLQQIRRTFKQRFQILIDQHGQEGITIEEPDYNQPLEIVNDVYNDAIKLIIIRKTLKKREYFLVGVLGAIQGILTKMGLNMNGFIIQQLTDISSYRPFLSQNIDPNITSEVVPSTWSYQLQIAGLVGVNAVVYFVINYMCTRIPLLGLDGNNPNVRKFGQQLQAEIRNFMFGGTDPLNEQGNNGQASVINDIINVVSTGDLSGLTSRFMGGGGGMGGLADAFTGMAAAATDGVDAAPAPRPAGRRNRNKT